MDNNGKNCEYKSHTGQVGIWIVYNQSTERNSLQPYTVAYAELNVML